jgi:uncharacterized protein
MKFINRTKEMADLKAYFTQEPNALLFVYGPKSSGKSTLLQKMVTELPHDQFTINFMNLREVLIYDFRTFLESFFPKTLYGKVKDVADGVTFNIGFFGLDVDDEKLAKHNPFKVMGEKLRSAHARGTQPILIVDEIQLLKNIYVNSTRYLLDELFNLFVSLTKTAHVAHVVLATSDSYFIEDLYHNVKLAQAAKFYCVDHFSHERVREWLSAEQWTEAEIETLWNSLEGSPWEIQEVLLQRQQGKSVEEACQSFINAKYAQIADYLFRLEADKESVFYQVLEDIIHTGYCRLADITDKTTGRALLKEMVAQDFWFYRVEEQTIVANAKSYVWAFKKLINHT